MRNYSSLMKALVVVSSLILSLSQCFTYEKKNQGETYKLELSSISAYQYEVRPNLETVTINLDKFSLVFTTN